MVQIILWAKYNDLPLPLLYFTLSTGHLFTFENLLQNKWPHTGSIVLFSADKLTHFRSRRKTIDAPKTQFIRFGCAVFFPPEVQYLPVPFCRQDNSLGFIYSVFWRSFKSLQIFNRTILLINHFHTEV